MSINHKNPTKVVTGVVRLSYANVWEPASINGSNPKYSVSLIIPKTDNQDHRCHQRRRGRRHQDGAAKFGGKIPNKAALKLPLRDGDLERDDEAYKGAYFVNANSTTAPQIVDRSRAAHPGSRRGLFRLLRPCVHQLLCLQLQREPRHRLRPGQHPRRCGTVNLWAVVLPPRMTSPPMWTMTSFPNNHSARVAEGNLCRPYVAGKETL